MSKNLELRLTRSLWKISHDPIGLVGEILRPPRIYGIHLTMSSDLCNTFYVFIEFVEHLFQLPHTCGIPITISSDLWDTFYDFIKFVGNSLWFPWVRENGETFLTTSSDLWDTPRDFLEFLGHPL